MINKKVLSFVQFRILFPGILLGGVLFRINSFSAVYLAWLLASFLFPKPCAAAKHTLMLLLGLAVVSFLFFTAQIIFQVVFFASAAASERVNQSCSTDEIWFRELGLVSFYRIPILDVFRLLIPDILTFIISVYLLASYRRQELQVSSDTQHGPTDTAARLRHITKFFESYILPVVSLGLTFLMAISAPSLLSGVYLIQVFIISLLWAFHFLKLNFQSGLLKSWVLFNYVLSLGHIMILYLYQFQLFHNQVKPTSLAIRILGLLQFVVVNCQEPTSINFNKDIQWYEISHAGLLLLMFICLSSMARVLRKGPDRFRQSQSPSIARTNPERRKLLSGDRPRDNGTFSGGHGHVVDSSDGSGIESSDEATHTHPEVYLSNPARHQKTIMYGCMAFLSGQSYIASLIAMMAWSILFHSWLSFIILVLACITWCTPIARRVCMASSPVLVIYAECLILLQFVFSMKLPELPTSVGNVSLVDIGLRSVPGSIPGLRLGAEGAFLLFFLATLHQYYNERQPDSSLIASGLTSLAVPVLSILHRTSMMMGQSDRGPNPLSPGMNYMDHSGLLRLFKNMLTKYWIVVCCIAFLVIAIQEDVSLYQIVYMVSFLICFIGYQVSVAMWRNLVKVVSWFMVVYSVLALMMIYVFQFPLLQNYLQIKLGSWLHVIGIKSHSSNDLLKELLLPTFFSILLVIQLHFFHHPLILKINKLAARRKYFLNVALDDPQLWSGHQTLIHNYETFYIGANLYLRFASAIFWRTAQLHVHKLIAILVAWVALQKVTALNFVLVLFAVVALPFSRRARFYYLFQICWSSVIIICLLFYQLDFVPENPFKKQCLVPITWSISSRLENTALWIGLHKTKEISKEVAGYIFIVLGIVGMKVIHHHQEFYGVSSYVPSGDIFARVTLNTADTSISAAVKYLANNMFRIFGLQANMVLLAVVTANRADGIGIVHSVWLLLLLGLKRSHVNKLWSFYITYLVVLVLFQYGLALGLPPFICLDYPWVTTLSSILIKLFHWTTNTVSPNHALIMGEFLLLLLASCHKTVLEEKSADVRDPESRDGQDQCARLNARPCRSSEQATFMNYIHDFTVHQTKFDILKELIFGHMFWITMAVVYGTAQSNINLPGMGLLLGCFVFLWYGQSAYLWPRRVLLARWKLFICYHAFVICVGVWLQPLACTTSLKLKSVSGYINQLFGLCCIDSDTCQTIGRFSVMNIVCLAFLLFQYTIFNSVFFRFIVEDQKRLVNMADRGALLVKENLACKYNMKRLNDSIIMDKIKKKVNNIKSRQSGKKSAQFEPRSHYEAIFSGDYYMFESSDEEDRDIEVEPVMASKQTQLSPETSQPVHISGDPGPTPLSLPSFLTTKLTSLPTAAVAEESLGQPNLLAADLTGEAVSAAAVNHLSSSLPPDSTLPPVATTSAALLPIVTEDAGAAESPSQAPVLDITCAYSLMLVNWLTGVMDKLSLDYRYVAEKLENETAALRTLPDPPSGATDGGSDIVESPMQETSINAAVLSQARNNEGDADPTPSGVPDVPELNLKHQSTSTVMGKFTVALYYLLVSHTDILCYCLIIVSHAYYASLLSLPLPFFVFLWGMLAAPRPPKNFWVFVITYVESIIVIKYIFQLETVTFNRCLGPEMTDPLCVYRILGIELNDSSSVLDLLLLLVLFYHRFCLKAHGLWKDGSPTSSSSASRSDGLPQRNASDNNMQATLSGKWYQKVLEYLKTLPELRVSPGGVDMYAVMFATQFLVFLIIVLSWSAFSSDDPGSAVDTVTQIFRSSVIPTTFLYMVLLMFILMIVDRFLYIKRLVLAKLAFNSILVVIFMSFMFFFVPSVTTRRFRSNIPAILMYLLMCFYFGISSYQVRFGYPRRILGNFLTKNYTLKSCYMFIVFRAIPFVLELRSILDWVCTETTLTLSLWLKMEDIYSNVYILKCFRESNKLFFQGRGKSYSSLLKWILGGFLIFLLVIIIWFPLLFMSIINVAYLPDHPLEATFTLTLGGYQPLFRFSAQSERIQKIDSMQWLTLSPTNNKLQSFLNEYRTRGNLFCIHVIGSSSALWPISPPAREALLDTLRSNNSISLQLKYEFIRDPHVLKSTFSPELVTGLWAKEVLDRRIKTELEHILMNVSNNSVTLPQVWPTFLRVPPSGSVGPLEVVSEGDPHNISLRLRRDSTDQPGSSLVEWWEITPDGDFPRCGTRSSRDHLVVIALVDLLPPGNLSFFASNGVIGLYVGFVWLFAKFIRIYFTSISTSIMFDELPNVDKVLRLCLDIYLVRESGELELEEDLFSKLLFLYRSPETLIRWTKYKGD